MALMTARVREIARHKVNVLRAGLHAGAPLWRLLAHDLSKLAPSAVLGATGGRHGDGADPPSLAAASRRHRAASAHHLEHWTSGAGCFRPMPDWAVREMLADWFAHEKARTGTWAWKAPLGSWHWLLTEWPRLSGEMHPATRARIFLEFDRIFACRSAEILVPLEADGGGTDGNLAGKHRTGAVAGARRPAIRGSGR
jgi:hypothetical protein